MVGRRRSPIAADEAHARPAFALAGKKLEVADDHAQVVQVPLKRLKVLRRLHHQVAQSLHSRGHARWTLGDVGAPHVVSEIENVGRLVRQCGQLVHAGDDAHRHSAGVDQVDRQAADVFRQRPRGSAGFVGQAQHVDLVARPKRHAGESRARSAAQDHARSARLGAAQVQLVRAVLCRLEAKGAREGPGAREVGLFELQPRDIGDSDHRIAGPAWVFAALRSVLAVQVAMGGFRQIHDPLQK